MGWWSATVMGGDTPLDWRANMFHIAFGKGQYETDDCNGLLTSEAINENLCAIVQKIEKTRYNRDRNIGWQVLGHEIITTGANMPKAIREKILDAIEADEWAAEGDSERVEEMARFASEVKKYKGKPTKIKEEGLFESLEKVITQGPDVVISAETALALLHMGDDLLLIMRRRKKSIKKEYKIAIEKLARAAGRIPTGRGANNG